jgi:hypothetical protein
MKTLNYETAWLVWSYKHGAWWGPDHSGYTMSISNAGVYTEEEAFEIQEQSMKGLHKDSSEARKLDWQNAAGVAPLRKNTVVWLMTTENDND